MTEPVNNFLQNFYRDSAGAFSPAKAATSAGLAALAYGALKPGSKIGEFLGMGSNQRPVGYTEGIPEYGVNRTLLPDAFAATTPTGEPRRPGSGGRRYFTDTTYTPTGNTMSATINPVNVPVTTRTATPQGMYGALNEEEARYLFEKLFSGQGISNTNVAGTNITNTGTANTNVAGTNITNTGGAANTNVAGTNITNTGTANTNVAGTNTTNTGTATTTVGAKPTKYTDAQVKDTLDTLIAQYPNDRDGLYRAVAQQITASGVPIADAAQQISRIVRVNGAAVTPQQIATEYNRLSAAPTTGFTDREVSNSLNALIAQNPGRGEELYRAIGEQIKASGVPIEAAAAQLASLMPEYSSSDIIAKYKQMGFAQGGLASLPQSNGYYLGGSTDGMADKIPANINGQQPAALSDGEFVMPADVVSHLGNGNSDAGAKVLYSMMDRVRQARTGTTEQGRKIAPNKFTPV